MPGPGQRYDLLRKHVDVFTKMLHGVEAGEVRPLHRTRVASRRLRELIPVLDLDGETAAKLSRRLRKTTAELGRVRELDVLAQLADSLAGCPPRAVEKLSSAIERERDATRKRFAAGRTIGELRRLGAKLRALLGDVEERRRSRRSGAGTRDWLWAIEARVARRAAKLERAIDDAGTVYVPERLHEVRIALKKLRYAMELAAEARDQTKTPELAALRRGQDLLGRLHDLQVLLEYARPLPETDADARRDLAALVETLETECRRLHARYVRERQALIVACHRAAETRAGRGMPQSARLRRPA